jgi:hypothetical protein
MWLSRVDQSPPESMYNALRPTMAVLITSELLEHRDPNIKVALTSCLTEVTRITAPEAPYDDDVMKVRFVALLGMERWCLYVLTIAILPCCRTCLRELWILLLTWMI